MSSEALSNEYLESLQTPESWANALLEHGTGILTALFSDKNELNIPNPKLATQHIPATTGGLHTINLADHGDISMPQLVGIQGKLSEQTDQRYYNRSGLRSKPRYPKDQSFLTFSDSITHLPPGYIAIQYEQPMDRISNPSYDDRSGGTIRELFVVPTKLGKKLIQNTLKDPTHMERVMQAMLPGLTTDRQRPKVKQLELIEGSDMGALFRGTKVLGATSNRQVLELSTPIGEVEPIPKLLPKADKVLDANLAYSPELPELQSDAPDETVDGRDLQGFLGSEAFIRDGDRLGIFRRYNHWEDRKDSRQFDITFYYVNDLVVKDSNQPFGRLSIQVIDKKLLTDGAIRIDLRRLGDKFILDLDITKGNFAQHIKNFAGDMRSLENSYGKLPPLLSNLSDELGDLPANDFLVGGLKQILSTMGR
jgi:hypothetical protein